MAWTKAKTTIAVCAGALLTASTAFLLLKEISRKPDLAALQGTWAGQEIGAGPGLATIVVNGSTSPLRGPIPLNGIKPPLSLHGNLHPQTSRDFIADSPESRYIEIDPRYLAMRV